MTICSYQRFHCVPLFLFKSFTTREKNEREEWRKASKKAFMTQRLADAQRLLGNIMTDKLELPEEPPATVTTPRRRTERSPISARDRSPLKKKTTKKDISPAKKPKVDIIL